jgi:chromosome segregation ATPase
MPDPKWLGELEHWLLPVVTGLAVWLARSWVNKLKDEIVELAKRVSQVEANTMTLSAAGELKQQLEKIGDHLSDSSDRLIRIESLLGDFKDMREQVHTVDRRLIQLETQHQQVMRMGGHKEL